MTQFDFSKFLGEGFSDLFKCNGSLPYDTAAITQAQRKNMQTISEVNKVVLSNLQTMAEKNAKMLSQIIEDNTALTKELLSEKTPEEKIAAQAELAKCLHDRSSKNAREVSVLLSRSQQQAADIISERISEGLNELSASASKVA